MILPSGKEIVFHDRYIAASGRIVFEFSMWATHAKRLANPKSPDVQHDWIIDRKLSRDSFIAILEEAVLDHDGKPISHPGDIGIRRHHGKRLNDPQGMLVHAPYAEIALEASL